MSVYRIADLNIAYAPKSPYAAAFLNNFLTDGEAQLTVTLSAQTIDAESSYMPEAPHGVLEVAALLRALGQTMPSFDRLVLHASAVVVNGKALAFVAPSGVGKTTHARLWETYKPDKARILNGDKVILRLHENGVTAYGSPWRGKEHLGFVGNAPLAGLFILTRAERSCCQALSPTDALPSLLRAVPFPSLQNERLTVLSLLDRLTAAVPLYHLQATPTVEAVDAVLQTIGGPL